MESYYKFALGMKRVFSLNSLKKLLPCFLATAVGWVWVLFTLKAQDAAAAAAATQLWMLPVVSMAAMVLSVAVGAEPLVVLFVIFLADVGIAVQLLLDANAAQSLKAGYLTGFVLAVVSGCAVHFISRRCKTVTIEAVSMTASLLLFIAAMLSPAVNGSHIAVKIMGHSALVGQPMLLVAIAGIAAADNDPDSTSPQRVLHVGVILAINSFFYLAMNELGSLMILIIAVAIMIFATEQIKIVDLFPAAALCGSAGFLMFKIVGLLGTKRPNSLLGKIWNKINQRFAYVNVLSKLDSLTEQEKLGASYQPLQGQKAILTSKWFGPSPYSISIPAKSSDYVTCWIANRLGLAAVLTVVVLVYIIFIYGLIFSSRSRGMVSAMGVACAAALAAGAVLNLLGATNIFPAVGVSFPLLSEGTMNVIASSMMTGLIVLSTIKEREEC